MYKAYLKRLLDLIVALLVLASLSPLILIITTVLLAVNRGNPFFFQERPGFREKKIRIVKFKTMLDIKDSNGNLLSDNERITSVGRFLRKSSLDELPQLLNVVKDDMSLVGPRPLLFKYIPLFSAEQKRRHEVKPGITGWAQVNGRNGISWTEKFRYDLYYVDHMSFLFDVKILWLTVIKVLKREGVNQSSERPMQPFNGSN